MNILIVFRKTLQSLGTSFDCSNWEEDREKEVSTEVKAPLTETAIPEADSQKEANPILTNKGSKSHSKKPTEASESVVIQSTSKEESLATKVEQLKVHKELAQAGVQGAQAGKLLPNSQI